MTGVVSPELVQVIGEATGVCLLAFLSWVIHRIRKSMQEVSSAVNGVDPGEKKLIDKVRSIETDMDQVKRQGRAQHIATVALDTTILAFSERLGEVGRKAATAHAAAQQAASEAHDAQRDALASQRALADFIARDAAANDTPEPD